MIIYDYIGLYRTILTILICLDDIGAILVPVTWTWPVVSGCAKSRDVDTMKSSSPQDHDYNQYCISQVVI